MRMSALVRIVAAVHGAHARAKRENNATNIAAAVVKHAFEFIIAVPAQI
jgi:hypothetical protein